MSRLSRAVRLVASALTFCLVFALAPAHAATPLTYANPPNAAVFHYFTLNQATALPGTWPN